MLFSNRGGARRKVSLAVYTEDDANDLSDLGIGTSSASGKSSLSEDFDNHSVIVSIFFYFFYYFNVRIIGSCVVAFIFNFSFVVFCFWLFNGFLYELQFFFLGFCFG